MKYRKYQASRAMVPLMFGLALGACQKVSYVSPSTTPNGKVVEKTGRFFLFGLAGSKKIKAENACKSGVAKVDARFTVGDTVLSAITLGLYTPRTYRLYCGQGEKQ